MTGKEHVTRDYQSLNSSETVGLPVGEKENDSDNRKFEGTHRLAEEYCPG